MKEHHVLFFACLVSLCGLLTARSVISALGDVKLLTPSVGPSVGTPARTSRSLVLPAHLFGLANRLRTMSCVNILAGDSGRGLSVHWLPSPECNVEFTDLFNTTAMARHGTNA